MARAVGEYGAVRVVSGRIVGQTETMTLYVGDRYQDFQAQAAYAGSVLLALIAIVTLLLMNRLRPKEETR
jgi:sulfate/thiosulfate transport system permease protein